MRLLKETLPRIQDVENTPFCDMGWKVQGEHIIVVSAIDNLLERCIESSDAMFNIYGTALRH